MRKIESPDRIYTIEEVCALIGCYAWTVYRAIKAGELEGRKEYRFAHCPRIGRIYRRQRWKITGAALRAWRDRKWAEEMEKRAEQAGGAAKVKE